MHVKVVSVNSKDFALASACVCVGIYACARMYLCVSVRAEYICARDGLSA